MKSKIGFVLFLIGGDGLDGNQMLASAIIYFIGLFVLWTESKKIDVPADQSERLLNNTLLCHFCTYYGIGKGICKDGKLS